MTRITTMSPIVLLDTDTYELAKVRMLPYEKAISFMTVFLIVISPLLFCASIIVALNDKELAEIYFIFGVVLLLTVIVTIYVSRSVDKLDRQKWTGSRKLLRVIGVLALGGILLKLIGDAQSHGASWTVVPWFFLVFFYDVGALYSSHWSTVIELLLMPVVSIFSLGLMSMSGRQLWAADEQARFFLRENPDQAFYGGRVFRSLFGIPRIVDLVPSGRLLITVLFMISYFCYALQLSSTFVYVLGMGYPLLHVAARCTEFSKFLECGYPVFSEYAVVSLFIIAFAAIPLVIAGPVLGAFFSALARKRIRFSILELTEKDPRKPILFLRPFRDDRVSLGDAKLIWAARVGKWLEHLSNLDRMLLEEGTPYGPVVALGRPGEELPPYCIARAYCNVENWHNDVLTLAKKSLAVVLCVDDVDGVWWEVKHVAARYPEKTLILVHPNNRARDRNAQIVERLCNLMALTVPAQVEGRSGSRKSSGVPGSILGLFVDGQGALTIAESSTFSRVAFVVVLRRFLRSKWGLIETQPELGASDQQPSA
jgi:hypothetical protein